MITSLTFTPDLGAVQAWRPEDVLAINLDELRCEVGGVNQLSSDCVFVLFTRSLHHFHMPARYNPCALLRLWE